MFSVIFPGQGSQSVGMAKEIYEKYSIVKDIFFRADKALGFNLSNIILNGPSSIMNLTENTQPAIFVVSYSFFTIIKKEFNIDLNKAKFFAGHSMGEFSALACANALDFEETVCLLNKRGKSMQVAVPVGEGGMLAVLGKDVDEIDKILNENDNFKKKCQIANDNCPGQVVVSGEVSAIKILQENLKKNSVKSINLPVSAPFHSFLMKKSTEIMTKHINSANIKKPSPKIISNVTADEKDDVDEIRNLLIKQIESKVRWRESIQYMIDNQVSKFIEIGPGKVLSGLVKRINKNVKTLSINNEENIKQITLL